MKHITFGLFTPAVLAGAKTVTRRSWAASKAREYRSGDLVWVYDRSPDEGGDRVGIVRLMADPVLEPMSKMMVSDFEAEGFVWLAEQYALGAGAREPDFTEFYERLRRSIGAGTRLRSVRNADRQPRLDPVQQMRHLVLEWVNVGGWRWVIRFELAKVLDRTKEVRYGYSESPGGPEGSDRDSVGLDRGGEAGSEQVGTLAVVGPGPDRLGDPAGEWDLPERVRGDDGDA